MSMMVKELVLLWTVANLAAAAEILEVVDDSNETLPCISTTYHVNITKLTLHHNHIVMNTVDIEALKNYPKLTELDLSYNLISQLPAGAFSALSNLESLSLRGNDLQMIRHETFTDLGKLKMLDLRENPWNCSREFLKLVEWMNDLGMQTGQNTTCATPQGLAGKSILDVISAYTTAKLPPVTTNTATATTTASPAHEESTTLGSQIVSNKDSLTKAEKIGKPEPVVTNTWKFLTGVIVIILCTSMVIVCAVKSPAWYKILFDYRHQRLREAEEPSVINTGRYSNFSLDTEQTETSAYELDQGLTGPTDDEDGFIEDGYIQPEDYKEHADVEEVQTQN